MDLSLRLLADASMAQGAFKDLGSAVTAAGSLIKDFAAESIKAFGEAERVSKQLARAAGDLAPIYEAQAEAMSKALAVEDEEVKQLQTLLLNYGALPEQVEGATKAILDYAAATGRDANGAMMQLIRGVESGTGSLGRMGVTFEATGDQATDMAAAIEALGSKFGGAAATDADTLEGRTRKASIAWGELKEQFGGFIGVVEQKLGVMQRLSAALETMSNTTFGAQQIVSTAAAVISGKSFGGAGAAPAIPAMQGPAELMSFGSLSMEATPQSKIAAGQREAEAQERHYQEALARYEDWQKKMIESEDRFDMQQEEIAERARERQLKEIEESNQLMMRGFEDQEKEHTKDLQKLGEIQAEMMRDQSRQQERELQNRVRTWTSIGIQLANALMEGIFLAIDQEATAKQKQDAGIKIARGVLSSVFGAFGYGWATNLAFGAADASMAINHTGGWIESFHDGGMVMGRDERLAKLQTGERVLSRAEVAGMGGPSGVNTAARGGRGGAPGSITIQAFDASSFLDMFGGGRGDRAFINAVRTNAGPLRSMFGA